jgi:hypothetical protein
MKKMMRKTPLSVLVICLLVSCGSQEELSKDLQARETQFMTGAVPGGTHFPYAFSMNSLADGKPFLSTEFMKAVQQNSPANATDNWMNLHQIGQKTLNNIYGLEEKESVYRVNTEIVGLTMLDQYLAGLPETEQVKTATIYYLEKLESVASNTELPIVLSSFFDVQEAMDNPVKKRLTTYYNVVLQEAIRQEEDSKEAKSLKKLKRKLASI